jgi:FKBP-type peptidyl-prolyl cis-trans isomerase FklB
MRIHTLAAIVFVISGMAIGGRFALAQGSAPGAAQQAPTASPSNTPPAAAAPSPFKNETAKLSYALGMNLGVNFHKQAEAIDPQSLLQGLQDGLAGGKTLLTEEEMGVALRQLQSEIRAKQEEKRRLVPEANRKAGEAFLSENKSKPGVVTLPSGLQYKILTAGTGPKPGLEDTVVCNYRGTLIDGTEFDSSARHGGPATFPVKGVIKGWTEALQLMPVGSKWQLVIPPDLAYGERGAGDAIGPNATLIFEVELVSIRGKW